MCMYDILYVFERQARYAVCAVRGPRVRVRPGTGRWRCRVRLRAAGCADRAPAVARPVPCRSVGGGAAAARAPCKKVDT